MGQTFVYNTGEDKPPKQELHLNFGVFIDGTLNNLENTKLRNQYGRGGEYGKIDQEISNYDIEKNDDIAYETIPNRDRISDLLKKQAKNNSDPNNLENPPLSDAEKKELDNSPKDSYLVASHRDGMDSWGMDKMGTDNSYSNDYTNVARMYLACKDDYKIYIEGMGTTNQNKDDEDGFAYGAGHTSGIRARVRKACDDLAKKIKSLNSNEENEDKKLTKIVIDVFGFSRGAAAARNFLYEINYKNAYYANKVGELQVIDGAEIKRREQERNKQNLEKERDGFKPRNQIYLDKSYSKPINIKPLELPKPKKMESIYVDSDGQSVKSKYVIDGVLPKRGHFALCMLDHGVVNSIEELDNLEIIFRFAGLYDTVSSYEEMDEMGNDDTVEKGGMHLQQSLFNEYDEYELHMQNMGYVQQIVHFTAQNEHRENFASTRIVGANVKNDEGYQRIVERNFPGVHCDIGGAYQNEEEKVDEIETDAFLESTTLEAYRKELIEQYWFDEKQIEIHSKVSLINPRVSIYAKLSGTRYLRKEYSYIPLHFMEEYCKPFLTEKLNRDLTREYSIKGYTLLEDSKAFIKKHIIEEGKEWVFKTDEELRIEKENKLSKEKLERDKKEGKLEDNNEKVQDGIQKYKPKFDYDKQIQFEKVEEKHRLEQIQQEAESRRTWVTSADHNGNNSTQQKVEPIKNFWEIEPTKVEEEAEVHLNSQGMLRKLRGQYFHWSANRDWMGMDPNSDRKRVIYPKQEKW